MNVQISTFVDFSGPIQELDPLLEALTEAVVNCGYGNTDEDEAATRSLITVTPSEIEQYEDATDFAKSLLKSASIIIIPMLVNEEENNERTGD